MFDTILDYIKKLFKSRLFPITLIYILLITVIIHRLFVLQIVKGQSHSESTNLKYTKTREIKSTRGNFYDKNGVLLATNVLSYSVTIEDSTQIKGNEQRNEIIHQLINIIEKNGDTIDHGFYIIKNKYGEFEFTIEGDALTRFKKNAYTYVLVNNKLTEEQENATAEEVYEFLKKGTGDNYTSMFGISDKYTVEETLKIMSIRYALLLNYPKYLQITVASNVSDKTVASVMESKAKLLGVQVEEQTHRIYNESVYFAHILGYTGLISADELEEAKKVSDQYNSTDVVGKSGLEEKLESYLSGTKGKELVTVNPLGKVIEAGNRTDPIAGNDVYLTIDSKIQKAAYHVLEKKIASILLQKIRPDMNYGSKGESAADILIPIYEVYNALIYNNIIDIKHFESKNATSLEKQVYQKYKTNLNSVLDRYDTLLAYNNSITNNKAGDMENYLNYFYKILKDNKILITSNIPSNDSNYQAYINNNKSLSYFLQYAISQNWVDLSKLGIGNEYLSAEELYNKLIRYTLELLVKDNNFNKMIYRNLVFSYKLTGTEISLLLFDQNVLEYKEDDVNSLKSGRLSAYQFITDKLKSLEITPAMLAIGPFSGSLVVTDVNNGDVIALVTYPSYDNNKLANKVDATYYKQLLSDESKPLINRPTSESIAPGSTYKMVTSVAGLEEGVINPFERIYDQGEFTKISYAAKCHIHPGSHGAVNIVDALKVSCNYFYYEVGYRLSIDNTGKFKDQLGIDKLGKYASLFGLNTKSGVELYESNPLISSRDAVRSSIGQGNNAFTPVQLARYVTTIANNGKNFDLTLIDKVKDKDGNVVKEFSAEIVNDLTSFKTSTWESIQKGMFAVTNEQKGSVTNLYKNFEVKVAGKTGTSQLNKSQPNNALFVSYAPYDNPQISVTSVIPSGFTSYNAAELAKDIYKLYFNIVDPTEMVNSEITVNDSNIAAVSD